MTEDLDEAGSWGIKSQVIAVVILLVIVAVMFIATSSYLPPMYEGTGNGFELAASIFQQQSHSPWTLLHHMALYVVIPFLIVFTLVFGVLEGSAGAYLSKKVWNVLAALLSLSVMLSGWFVTLAAIVGGAGSIFITVLIIYLLGLIFFDATMMHSAIGRKRLRFFSKDEDLREQAKKLDRRMLNICEELENWTDDGQARGDSTIRGAAAEAAQLDIGNLAALEEEAEKVREQAQRDGLMTKVRQLANLVQHKARLARQFDEWERENLREDARDVHRR